MAAAPSTSRVRPKEFHFPVTVEWLGERRVAAHVEGKPTIEITSPPVFRGSDPTTWSPEDFFVAAAASCLAVTFTGLAARAGLAYTSLSGDGEGVAGKRADGASASRGCRSDSNSRLSLATKHRPERSPRRLKGHVSSRPPSTSPSRRRSR
jgi:organic hydroperoxide reductase OsmC/OhrA